MTDREKCIALIDNDILVKSDVIILLEGDGFSRLAKCAELFHANYAPVICFSGGAKNLEYGSFPFDLFIDKLKEFNLSKDNFILEVKSQHTEEQAIEIIRIAKKYSWKRIILVASNFHQYRAYLTFLKTLKKSDYELVIMNAPVRDLPWFRTEPWGKRFDLLTSEFEKIERYVGLGSALSYQIVFEYQKWKEQCITTN